MRFLPLLAALVLAAPAWAQTQFYQQSFETAAGYSTSITEYTDGFSDFFARTDTTDVTDSYQIDGFDGNWIFAAQDIDSEGASLPVRLDISDIDISGKTNLSFRGLFAEDEANDSNFDWDESDFVHIKYRIDSDDDADLVNLIWFENDGNTFNGAALQDTDFDGTGDGTALTATLSEFAAAIAGTGSTLDIVVIFSLDSGDEDIAIDNFRVFGEDVVVAAPEIDVTPTSIDFGTVDVGSSSPGMVTISNGGDAALTISSIGISGTGFSIVSGGEAGSIPVDGTRQVMLAFSPAAAGAATGTLTINSDDADEGTVEVSLSGTGQEVVTPEPEIDVTPTSVDFGTVTVGSSAQQTVTISNGGDAPLTISSISVSEGALVGATFFVVSGGEAGTIPVDGTRQVVVAFSPASAGPAVGALSIESNDADEGTVEVSLSGTGEEEPTPTDCDYAFGIVNLTSTSIPSAGGQIRYKFEIDNSASASAATVDIWATLTVGDEVIYVRNPRTPTVPANSVYRAGYNQSVPAFAPDGAYTYTVYAGDFNEDSPADSEVCGSGVFSVTKGDPTKANMAALEASDWDDVEIVNAEIALEQALETTDAPVQVGPNPARDRATFSFGLAEASDVTIAVYDTRGRQVATIAEGTFEAGQHTASLSRALPAGVYVWRLTAGTRVETGRLTVVR